MNSSYSKTYSELPVGWCPSRRTWLTSSRFNYLSPQKSSDLRGFCSNDAMRRIQFLETVFTSNKYRAKDNIDRRLVASSNPFVVCSGFLKCRFHELLHHLLFWLVNVKNGAVVGSWTVCGETYSYTHCLYRPVHRNFVWLSITFPKNIEEGWKLKKVL